MKITKDLRKYTAPARGSKAWQAIYNQCTAVERVNACLKEFFQLNNVRYHSGKRAKIHFDFATLTYNASKLAVNRINTALYQQANYVCVESGLHTVGTTEGQIFENGILKYCSFVSF